MWIKGGDDHADGAGHSGQRLANEAEADDAERWPRSSLP
jgi:hypothetical protein